MATLPPGQVTLGQLRLLAKRESYTVNDSNIDDPTWNSWLNSGIREVYGKLVTSYGNNYEQVYPYPVIVADGLNDHYPLPLDFFKLNGVDAQVGSDPNGWYSLPQFMYAERNRFMSPNIAIRGLPYDIAYRLEGNNIWFIPLPQGGTNFRFLYTPRLQEVADVGTVTFINVQPGDVVRINSFNLTAAPFGTPQQAGNFNIGGFGATNLGDAGTAAAFAATYAALQSIFTGITPILLPTASTMTSTGNMATLTLLTGLSVIWSFIPASPTFYPGTITLDPRPVVTPNNLTGAWTNVVDGINDYEEFAVIDAAIKAKDMLDVDTSVLQGRRAAFFVRIDNEAENRNIGAPQQVSDVRRGNGLGFYGGGGGSYGNW